MKKIFILVTVLLSIIMTVQATFMNVEKSDHTIYSYDVDNVDQVTFSDEAEGKSKPDTIKVTIPIAVPTLREVHTIDTILVAVHDTMIVYIEEETKNKTLYSGQIGEYDYVDLGLPSGTKWATCNVGAKHPSEFGYYLNFGETVPIKENSKWVDNQNDVNKTDDAATALWGEAWRSPSSEEIAELIDGCEWEWTNNFEGTGTHGQIGTSKTNGKQIFLPAAGVTLKNRPTKVGEMGFYWSNTRNGKYLMFEKIHLNLSGLGNGSMSMGKSLRPVVNNLFSTQETKEMNNETSQDTPNDKEAVDTIDSIQSNTPSSVSYNDKMQENLLIENGETSITNFRLGFDKISDNVLTQSSVALLPSEVDSGRITILDMAQEIEKSDNVLTQSSVALLPSEADRGRENLLEMAQETEKSDNVLTQSSVALLPSEVDNGRITILSISER